MALNNQDKKLLNDLFSAFLKSPNGINRARFRADNEQFISEIDQLESVGFVIRNNDLCSISLLSLAYLAKENPDAQSLVQKCSLVFALIQGNYRNNLGEEIKVPRIIKRSGLSEDNVRTALVIIVQAPILRSFDLKERMHLLHHRKPSLNTNHLKIF